jgi:hypothetical protein
VFLARLSTDVLSPQYNILFNNYFMQKAAYISRSIEEPKQNTTEMHGVVSKSSKFV